MKTSKFLFVTFAMLLSCSTMQAQFGKALGKAIENAAKNATVRKAEQKTDQAVNKTIDKVTDPNTYKDEESDENKSSSNTQTGNDQSSSTSATATNASQTSQQSAKALEMAYAKSDFVPGDEIIFEDDQSNEKMGEFPSMWDLLSGNAEIASVDGRKCINITDRATVIVPLMNDMKNYLPDVFTLELDFYVNDIYKESDYNKSTAQIFWLQFYNQQDNEIAYVKFAWDNIGWEYYAPSEESRRSGSADFTYKPNSWNHLAVSFNKRAFKVYINGVRTTNIPNMVAPNRFRIENRGSDRAANHRDLISNVRLAKGAVPLYDRMMSDGKFITYGITFDVGKSTIKPESMGEINRIVALMNENPSLKFSVEGHTDNTGNASSNQTLSEARSQAVVDKLVENGVAADRLKAAGKGQTSPIADNGTDEGRAKNRRVEFMKL